MSDPAPVPQSGSRKRRLARRFLIGLFVLTALGFGYSFGMDSLSLFAREHTVKPRQLSQITGEFEFGPYDSDHLSILLSNGNGSRAVWLRVLDPGTSVTPYAGLLNLHFVKETHEISNLESKHSFIGSSAGAIVRAQKITIVLQKSAMSDVMTYEFHVRVDPVLKDQVGVKVTNEGVAVRLNFDFDKDRRAWIARLEGTAPPDTFEVSVSIPDPLPISEDVELQIPSRIDVLADRPCDEEISEGLKDVGIRLVSFGTHQWLPPGGSQDVHPLDPVAGMKTFCARVTLDQENSQGDWGVTLVLRIPEAEYLDELPIAKVRQIDSIALLHAYGF